MFEMKLRHAMLLLLLPKVARRLMFVSVIENIGMRLLMRIMLSVVALVEMLLAVSSCT